VLNVYGNADSFINLALDRTPLLPHRKQERKRG